MGITFLLDLIMLSERYAASQQSTLPACYPGARPHNQTAQPRELLGVSWGPGAAWATPAHPAKSNARQLRSQPLETKWSYFIALAVD